MVALNDGHSANLGAKYVETTEEFRCILLDEISQIYRKEILTSTHQPPPESHHCYKFGFSICDETEIVTPSQMGNDCWLLTNSKSQPNLASPDARGRA